VTWGGVFAHVGDDLLRARAAEVEDALRAKPRPTKLDEKAAWCLRHFLKALAPSSIVLTILLSDEVAAELARAVTRTEPVAPTARWTSAGGYHVTLADFGDVTNARLPEVLGAVVEVSLRHGPAELECAGAGVFGGKRPTVLWAGLGGDVAALQALHRDLHGSVAPFGVSAPTHPFVPHITLAKAGDEANGDRALAQAAVSLKHAHFGGFQARALTILRGGRVIATVPLRGGEAGKGATPAAPALAVVHAVRAAVDPKLGLVRVADVVRALQAGGMVLEDIHRELFAAHDRGEIELRPESGGEFLRKGDAAVVPKGPREVLYTYARIPEGAARRTDASAPTPKEDDDAVRAGLRTLASREPPGALLSVRTLRELLPSLDKSRFDSAVLRLFRAEEIDLHHHDFPSSLSEVERNKLVRDEQRIHYVGVAFRNRS
jgi:RNA 2',3'-cyclic 3'-phosphodiesterase